MTDPDPPTVLVTGAAGNLGSLLRTELAGHYRLRLTDRDPITGLGPGETFVRADLRDLDEVVAAVSGVDAVVHLGAVPGEDDWEPIVDVNIVGTYNVFEAARRADVERIVFASSNHVVGFYPRGTRIGSDVTVRPDSRYGVSKACGEALGALYADKYGRRVTCLRIGTVLDQPRTTRDLATWLSPRDLGQLVRIGLDHADIRYEVLYGMSDNDRAWWDGSAATRLGYRPRDRAEDHAATVLAGTDPAAGTTGTTRADELQGGAYTTSEGGGHRPQTRRSRWKWAKRTD